MPLLIMVFLILPATPFWLIIYFFLARGAYRHEQRWTARFLHLFTLLLIIADISFAITMRSGGSVFCC
jgi:hypothetical protein